MSRCRQDSNRVGTYARRTQLRYPEETFVRSFSLRQRRRAFVGRQLRSVRIVGQDSAFVGFGCWTYYSSFRRSHQGSNISQAFFFTFFFLLYLEALLLGKYLHMSVYASRIVLNTHWVTYSGTFVKRFYSFLGRIECCFLCRQPSDCFW